MASRFGPNDRAGFAVHPMPHTKASAPIEAATHHSSSSSKHADPPVSALTAPNGNPFIQPLAVSPVQHAAAAPASGSAKRDRDTVLDQRPKSPLPGDPAAAKKLKPDTLAPPLPSTAKPSTTLPIKPAAAATTTALATPSAAKPAATAPAGLTATTAAAAAPAVSARDILAQVNAMMGAVTDESKKAEAFHKKTEESIAHLASVLSSLQSHMTEVNGLRAATDGVVTQMTANHKLLLHEVGTLQLKVLDLGTQIANRPPSSAAASSAAVSSADLSAHGLIGVLYLNQHPGDAAKQHHHQQHHHEQTTTITTTTTNDTDNEGAAVEETAELGDSDLHVAPLTMEQIAEVAADVARQAEADALEAEADAELQDAELEEADGGF